MGIYAVAGTLSETWYFIPTALVTALYPKLIELKGVDEQVYQYRLQQLFDALLLLALVLAVFVNLLAEPLILLIYGEQYQASVAVLIVHIWAALFIFMRAVLSKWIIIEDLLVFSLVTQGGGALVNVVLNYYWIEAYGVLGAAYATLVSYAVASYVALIFAKRTRGIFWMMTKAFFSPLRYAAKLF